MVDVVEDAKDRRPVPPTRTGAPQFVRITDDLPPVDQIYDQIKTAIMAMAIEPGALISEAELGAAVGASRTPVRAALARLRDEGLIATRPSKGNFVTRLDERTIRAAHMIRHAIERATVEHLCASGLSDAAALALADNIAASRRAIADGDGPAFRFLDDRFHLLLAEATDLPRIVASLTREKLELDRLRVLSLSDSGHLQMLLADHIDILAAVTAGDTPRALDNLQAHLERVLTTLGDLKDRNQKFFA